MKNNLLLIMITFLMSISFVGCGDSSSGTFRDPIAKPPSVGFVRFAQFSPDAPNMDILVDGQTIVTNAPFKSVSTYLTFTPGAHQVQFFATGTTSNPVIDTQFQVDSRKNQTVAAIDTLASVRAKVYSDARDNTTSGVLLRVLHSSPDAGPVDLTLADGTVLVSNLSFPNDSTYREIAPGTYDLQLRVAGTNTVIRDYRRVQLQAGKTMLTAVALGLLADQSLDVNIVSDDPFAEVTDVELNATRTSLRTAHLSPGAPNVDVFVDGVAVAQNVPYAKVGNYFTTPARSSATVQVFQAGTNTELLSETFSLSLDPNAHLTIAAVGSIVDTNLELVAYVDALATSGGSAVNTSLRAVHAIPNATGGVGAVDVTVPTSANQIIADALVFPTASNYVVFGQDTNATIDVQLDSGGDLVQLIGQNLSAGNVFSAFVIGRVADGVNPPTILLVRDI